VEGARQRRDNLVVGTAAEQRVRMSDRRDARCGLACSPRSGWLKRGGAKSGMRKPMKIYELPKASKLRNTSASSI
jgi:hypothetical protein